MAVAVLEAGPADRGHWLARHMPPAVNNVLAPHMTDFARTLAGDEDHAQRQSVHAVDVVERMPKWRDLRVSEHTLAIVGDVLRHGTARLTDSKSSRIAHANIALTWRIVCVATLGFSIVDIIVLTSVRLIEAACESRQRGRAKRRTSASACLQLRLFFFACSSR